MRKIIIPVYFSKIAAFFGWGVHRTFGLFMFKGLNEILISSKALKLRVIFQKYALKDKQIINYTEINGIWARSPLRPDKIYHFYRKIGYS